MQLTENFTLAEFQAASPGRLLTPDEIERAGEWARQVLQPARDRFGRIDVTSYVRVGAAIGAGCHADGRGIDIAPRDAHIGEVHRFLATEAEAGRMPLLGEILDERLALGGPHIHLSMSPCGAPNGPEILRIVGHDDDGPEWERGAARAGALGVLVLLFVVALLFW